MSEALSVYTAELKTNSFDELCGAVTNWDQEYCQMSNGRFDGQLKLAQVNGTQVLRIRWGRKIRYQGSPPAGSFAFALPLDQPDDITWVGRKAGLDSVAIQAPNRVGELISSDFYDALVLGVSEHDVLAKMKALSGTEAISESFHGISALPAASAARLRQMGMDFLQFSQAAADNDALRVALFSDQLVKIFLWELAKAQNTAENRIANSKRAKIVSDANDLILADTEGGLGLIDLCAFLNVSLRTLHNSFNDITGDSPATWLRRMRLNVAHKKLLRASGRDTTVHRVAAECGFIHLGHFSEQYRRLFGCLPSETLRLR